MTLRQRPRLADGFGSPEERLGEYAQRLKRHRDGRLVVWVGLSTLDRVYQRRLGDLMLFVRNTLAAFTENGRGEIFTLSSGDVVAVLLKPRKDRLLDQLYRLDYALAPEDGEELDVAKELCELMDMETEYPAFLARVLRLSESGDGEADLSGERPGALPYARGLDEGLNALLDNKAGADAGREGSFDLDGQAFLGSATLLGASDAKVEFAGRSALLSRLLTVHEIGVYEGDAPVAPYGKYFSIDRQAVIDGFSLTEEASRTPKIVDRFAEEADRALLLQSPQILKRVQVARRMGQVWLEMGLTSYFGVELLNVWSGLSASLRPGLTLLIPHEQATRDRDAFDYLLDFCTGAGIDLGLSGVSLTELAKVHDTWPLMPTIVADLSRQGLGSLTPEAVREIKRVVERPGGPEVLFGQIADEARLEAARLLSGRLVCGRAIDGAFNAAAPSQGEVPAVAMDAPSEAPREAPSEAEQPSEWVQIQDLG